MRLDRFVSQSLNLSRKQARLLVRRGLVELAGVAAARPDLEISADAVVCVEGRQLGLPQARYLMLHKPLGVVSATRDDRAPTVLSLLPAAVADGLHLVGRLDKETSGLLLLTDDGQWSHRLTSPRHACRKTYRVSLARPLCEDAERRLLDGLRLRGESRPTRPARLWRHGEREVVIEVTEGRYHLVRRMFAALDNHVLALHRDAVGSLRLDDALAPGQWRPLTGDERIRVCAEAG